MMSSATPEQKELLYCWTTNGLNVLVPKKRGSGYVKTPYGHHLNTGLSRIESIAQCDLYGLDGELYFQVDGAIYHGGDTKRAEFVNRIIPMLEAHYGWPAREIDATEFWQLHPLPSSETLARST